MITPRVAARTIRSGLPNQAADGGLTKLAWTNRARPSARPDFPGAGQNGKGMGLAQDPPAFLFGRGHIIMRDERFEKFPDTKPFEDIFRFEPGAAGHDAEIEMHGPELAKQRLLEKEFLEMNKALGAAEKRRSFFVF